MSATSKREATRFEARIQRQKNRLVAVPAPIQRAVGLKKQPNNHLLHISIRPLGKGRWNHHYVKLTRDNEFSIPSDVTRLEQGDEVEVRIHRVIADSPPPSQEPTRSGAGLILELDEKSRPGWREDGSSRVDDYLDAEVRR
ncbi:MAG: hypothetical protein R6V85_11190 [Polyangia bacterium]